MVEGCCRRSYRGDFLLLLCLLLLQVDERYLPQLAQLLTYPQSVGIVGGRPGASLYFVGTQGDSVLYLDPHEVQQVGPGRFLCTK